MSAQTAGERLAEALADARHRGDRVPCTGDDAWISEDAGDRAEAARRCVTCPVSAVCHAAALEVRPTHGVWASVDWTDRKQRPKRATQNVGAA
jgi:hypothetical protein